MQPALQRVVVDLALAEADLGVGAHVVQGEDLAAGAHQRDRRLPDLQAEDAAVRDVSDLADLLPVGGVGAHRASSASTADRTRSRISGTSIFSSSWAKKPWMTRRRASSNGMPRACR